MCHVPCRSADAIVRCLVALALEDPRYSGVDINMADRGRVLGRSDGDVLIIDAVAARGVEVLAGETSIACVRR